MKASTNRAQRIEREIHLLEKLKRGSAIFDFHPRGDNSELLMVTFNGKGIVARLDEGSSEESVGHDSNHRDSNADDTDFDTLINDIHRIQISLPEGYPKCAPEIRWQSGLLHPNVSFSGFVDLEELGLPWQPEMTLDVVCDRLWDVNRLAYVNLPAATNHTARKWFEEDCTFSMPVDARPLRNRTLARPQNIVSYRRIGKTDSPPLAPQAELMYIGDEKNTTSNKVRDHAGKSPARKMVEAEVINPTNDDGIFFIN